MFLDFCNFVPPTANIASVMREEPPRKGLFSRTRTEAPSSDAAQAADKPAPPPPTITISKSPSYLVGGSTGIASARLNRERAATDPLKVKKFRLVNVIFAP